MIMDRYLNPHNTGKQLKQLACITTFALAAVLSPSAAQAQVPVIDLPAGIACPGFDVRLEINGQVQVNRTFTDKNGNPIRAISAGRGSVLTFVNMQNGTSITLKTGGSVSRTTYNRDGSYTVTATGHNGLILFPTDVPAGPTTTLYLGKLVYSVDTSGITTVLQTTGKQVDICAVLVV
jgi:hypothetical protein